MATAQTEPVRLSTNCIIGNRYYRAGEPLPYTNEADLPAPLRPLVVSGEQGGDDADEPRGGFELNALYQLTSDGRLGRQVQRQVSQMEAENAEQEWREEEMDAPLPPEIAADLEDAHRQHVDFTAAQAAADARRADTISDGAAADLEPPQLFVKRGGRHYSPAGTARVKAGEPVFVKGSDGNFAHRHN